jgi:hypothetical protein
MSVLRCAQTSGSVDAARSVLPVNRPKQPCRLATISSIDDTCADGNSMANRMASRRRQTSVTAAPLSSVT